MAHSSVWIKVSLVAGVAAALTAYLLGLTAPWSVALAVVTAAALAAAPRFLLGTLVGASTAGPREQALRSGSELSGVEFEDQVARVARSCGVPVIMTPVTGDFGVDLILGKRPNRLAVQCKRQSRPVGAGAVQQVVAGAPMHDCANTMVVTNHGFTPAARKLAEQHGCELVGRAELPRLRSVIRRLTAPTEPTEQTGIS